MLVKVYSTTTCPYCKMLKEYLAGHNVAFNEVLVDEDEAGREEMMAASGGFLGVPFTVIIRDDGTKETVLGFDKNKINQVLGISS